MLTRALCVAMLAGCWTGRPTSEPARWRTAPVPDAIPRGAWLVAAMDFDDRDSPQQRENEDKARRDPAAVRKGDGCTMPTLHVAVAIYGRDQFLAATRGGVHRDAMLACLADVGRAKGQLVTTRTERGLDVVEIGSFVVTVSTAGMIVGATTRTLFSRAIADELAPVAADPELGPLIRRARAGGELWIAALVPRGPSLVDGALTAIDAHPVGRVVSIVGAIRFAAPQRVELEVDLESELDASLLATALEARRASLRAGVTGELQPLLDTIHIEPVGRRVRITGTPTGLDWMKVFTAAAAALAALAP